MEELAELFDRAMGDESFGRWVNEAYHQGNLDNLSVEQKALLAEEMVARVAERVLKGEELSLAETGLWTRFVSWLRKAFGLADEMDLLDPQIAEFTRALLREGQTPTFRGLRLSINLCAGNHVVTVTNIGFYPVHFWY